MCKNSIIKQGYGANKSVNDSLLSHNSGIGNEKTEPVERSNNPKEAFISEVQEFNHNIDFNFSLNGKETIILRNFYDSSDLNILII